MTVREIYESVLVEINKENAPTFTVEEFNYLLNKAVLAFVNEKYNFYAANQQLSDDLRVLLKTSVHNVSSTPGDVTFNKTRSIFIEADGSDAIVSNVSDLVKGDTIKIGSGNAVVIATIMQDDTLFPYYKLTGTGITTGAQVGDPIYLQTEPAEPTDEYDSVYLSEGFNNDEVLDIELSTSDYLHVVSCRVVMQGHKYSVGADGTKYTNLTFPAKRLTFDMLNYIENNTYLRPARNRPYYQVFDNKDNISTVKYSTEDPNSRDYQNRPKFKVYIGRSNKVLNPKQVSIDYIKMPAFVLLDDLDLFSAGEDSSQVLEFPDYLKNEIVRRVTDYLLEKTGNPRIQSHPALNQEIPTVPMNMQGQQQTQGATPAQQQQQQAQ